MKAFSVLITSFLSSHKQHSGSEPHTDEIMVTSVSLSCSKRGQAESGADSVERFTGGKYSVKHSTSGTDSVEHSTRGIDSVKHSTSGADSVEHSTRDIDSVKHSASGTDSVEHSTRGIDSGEHSTRRIDSVKHSTSGADPVEHSARDKGLAEHSASGSKASIKHYTESVKLSTSDTVFSAQHPQCPKTKTDAHCLSTPQQSVRNTEGSPKSSDFVPEILHMQNNHHNDELAPDVPMVFVIILLLGYCCLGAWFIRRSNSDWSFLDGLYFWFITITTVGFGDLELKRASTDGESKLISPGGIVFIQICVIAFVVVGLALMSAFVTLCIERGHHYRRIFCNITCNAVQDTRTSRDQKTDNDTPSPS